MPNETAAPDAPRRGLMLVLASPSGTGKSTLSERLRRDDPTVTFSVSWTTRPARGEEVDGVHYTFVSKELFREQRAAGQFLEWAEVHDHYYGSPRAEVMARLEAGLDVLFDIDWQGAQQLAESAPADVVRVFILPPSMAELKRRLEGRGTDAPEVIKRRLSNAYSEIARAETFDYVLLNDDLDTTYTRLVTILAAERLRRPRQPWIHPTVEALLREDV
jgi:guanylate kinase